MNDFRDSSADYVSGSSGSSSGDVSVLNTLIGTLLDSVDGFQKSAEHVENRQYAEIFNERARERQQAVAKLQAAAAQAGGTPEDEATTLGAMHRMFVDLKSAITGRDDVAIIKEVERGEDYLKEKFETALRNADLSPQARAAVEDAWTSVKSGHDQVSQLKHGLTT